MRAYVDESEPGGGLDHTTYVLAAVLVIHDAVHDARSAVEDARPRGMRKLHWREAIDVQRRAWIELLRFAVEVVVIHYDGDPARAERRRRRCLERLVFELETRGVTELVLESRGPKADHGDRRMLDAFRGTGIGRAMRHDHRSGADEPLLALADIACGAHAAGAITGHATAWSVVEIS